MWNVICGTIFRAGHMEPLVARPKRARNLTQDLVAHFSERIRSGAIRPGEKLPTESEIVLEQGVSRTVVREAISKLQATGLVETRHGIGTFVLDLPSEAEFGIDPTTIITIRDVLQMLELRISLETEAAGLAAQRCTGEQLKKLRAILDAFKGNLETGGDTVTHDFDFHLQIAAATGNRYFNDIMRYLGTTTIPRTRINTAQLSRNDQVQYLIRLTLEHECIYDAIAQQDPEAARVAMRTHLTNSRERLRRAHDEAAKSR